MTIKNLLIVLVATSALSGCAGLVWENTGHNGPIIENTTMARYARSCARDLGNYKYCKTAFVDRNGDYLQLKDIRKEIDRFLYKLPPIEPWVQGTSYVHRRPYGGYETHYYSPSGKRIFKGYRARSGRVPFSFYILTISPTVVLAVPKDPSIYERCGVSRDCIHSKQLKESFYRYSSEPKVFPKSFFFIPSEDIGPTYLPKGSKKYNIQLEDSVIKLSSTDGFWTHTREFLNDSSVKQ